MTHDDTTDLVARLKRAMRSTRPTQDARQRMIDGALSRRPAPFGRWLLLVPVAAALLMALWLHFQPVPPGASHHGASSGPAVVQRRTPVVYQTRARVRTVMVGPNHVHLEPHTTLRVASPDPTATVVILDQGKASFSVQPLSRGSFRVRAGQLTVKVVGTRFSVATVSQCKQVAVTEGRVQVSDGNRRVTLSHGETQLFCDDHTTAAGSSAAFRSALEQGSPAPRGEPLPGEDTVREAMRLVHGGDSRRVVTLLSDYLDKHWGGAFEEEALFHLCLAHARLGQQAQARRVAKEFIGRFPDSQRARRLGRLFSDDAPVRP